MIRHLEDHLLTLKRNINQIFSGVPPKGFILKRSKSLIFKEKRTNLNSNKKNPVHTHLRLLILNK